MSRVIDKGQPAFRYTFQRENGSVVGSGIVTVHEGQKLEDCIESMRRGRLGWTVVIEHLTPLPTLLVMDCVGVK